MDLKGKKILVLGMAESGIASAIKLKGLGAKVLVSDNRYDEETAKNSLKLAGRGIESDLGPQDERLLAGVDLVVISPGVPSSIPLVAAARSRSLEVIGEIELAYRLGAKDGFIVAVTGTNGKTTTTTLAGKIILSHFPTKVAGNIGPTLIDAIEDDSKDIKYVVELSSFQLENIRDFKADISVLLNVTDDHLDRYRDFAEYKRAKGEIFKNQKMGDFAILNLDDPNVADFQNETQAQVFFTSKRRRVKRGCFVSGEKIVFSDESGEMEICEVEDLKIKGDHNLDNAMAAAAAALILKIPVEKVKKELSTFKGLSHRVEFLGEISGISFFDDSKATNPDAVIKAFTSFTGPIVLIAGGRNKKNSFDALAEAAAGKVKRALLIGESKDDIKAALSAKGIDASFSDTLLEATRLAFEAAQKGDSILLSPACASQDMFKDYKHRGEVFKTAFLSLKKEQEDGKKGS